MTLYLITIGWLYVTLMMALAEAMAPGGSLLGALLTFVLYGLLPLSIVMYVLGTPGRRRARRAAEAAEAETVSASQSDAGGHAPGDRRAPVREEP